MPPPLSSRGVLLLLGLLPAASAARQKADTVPPPRTLPELEARIRAVLDSTHTPGLAIALVTRDSDLWVAGLGKADVASGREANAETLFRIGSTSKAFVSLAVMRLVNEGRLHLDDEVKQLAPEIAFSNPWEATDPVRLVHLLEHTTGWDDLALRDYANNDSTPLTLQQGLAFNPKTRTSRWPPGTRVSYCNSGPPVAAYIVQKIVGKPFEDIVTEWFFRPIGMTTATYFRVDSLRQRLTTLYHPDGVTPYPYWHILQRPAGSINASALDMARYVQFLLNRGTVRGVRLLPREAIERMELPASSLTARSGLSLGYGLHLATYLDSLFVWRGHDGGVAGGRTVMAYLPEAGRGFAFMTNGGNSETVERIGRLVRDFLTRDLTPPAPQATIAMPAIAGNYRGWFQDDDPRNQDFYFLTRLLGLVHATVDDSSYVLKPVVGPAIHYLPVSSTTFRRSGRPVATLALVSDSAGQRPVALEQMGYLVPNEYGRLPSPLAWAEIALTAALLLCAVVTLLFGLVWVPRRWFGKLRSAPYLGVRTWPLIAVLSFGMAVLLSLLGGEDPFVRLARPTLWSVGLFLSTILYAIAALLGFVAVVRLPKGALRPGLRYYAWITASLLLISAGYLAWWGMIGYRSWA